MQENNITWMEMLALIGEHHIEVARMYGDGILTDSELFSPVSEKEARTIKQFYHGQRRSH